MHHYRIIHYTVLVFLAHELSGVEPGNQDSNRKGRNRQFVRFRLLKNKIRLLEKKLAVDLAIHQRILQSQIDGIAETIRNNEQNSLVQINSEVQTLKSEVHELALTQRGLASQISKLKRESTSWVEAVHNQNQKIANVGSLLNNLSVAVGKIRNPGIQHDVQHFGSEPPPGDGLPGETMETSHQTSSPVSIGDLRLIPIPNHKGHHRVEIYFGEWGTVCGSRFGNIEATVACKQLGHVWGEKSSLSYPGSGDTLLDDVECKGFEDQLVSCAYIFNSSSCSHDNDAVLACHNVTHPDEGTVRLIGDLSPNIGGVEISHDGIWRAVCGDNFGSSEAGVVCKQLGYNKGEVFSVATIDMTFDLAWMLNACCEGNERSLADCGFEGWTSAYCLPSEYFGVKCNK